MCITRGQDSNMQKKLCSTIFKIFLTSYSLQKNLKKDVIFTRKYCCMRRIIFKAIARHTLHIVSNTRSTIMTLLHSRTDLIMADSLEEQYVNGSPQKNVIQFKLLFSCHVWFPMLCFYHRPLYRSTCFDCSYTGKERAAFSLLVFFVSRK